MNKVVHDQGSKVLIIAEAGVNHNGDLQKAKALIDAAALAGVDLVKFQTFKASKIVSAKAPKAEYQTENMPSEQDGQLQMLEQLELSTDDHFELIEYCKQKDISFFSTAFDNDSLEFLNSLGLDLFKVPSGEITNYPYLKKMASFGKPVIMSTGMCEMSEINDAVRLLNEEGISKEQITVLHCNTEYPTPMEDVNLKAMNSIGASLGVQVGYSDHTLGIEVPIAAVALGARVIEKHFTLDRNLPGPDHKASLEPDELKAMVAAIRNIEAAMAGNGDKQPSPSEQKNIAIARKSLHLASPMNAGDKISAECLIPLRPGDGISPMKWTKVLGKTVNKRLDVGHKLSWEDFK